MRTRNAAERGGFTIIELMVVTLIIAILMSVAFKIAGVGEDARDPVEADEHGQRSLASISRAASAGERDASMRTRTPLDS